MRAHHHRPDRSHENFSTPGDATFEAAHHFWPILPRERALASREERPGPGTFSSPAFQTEDRRGFRPALVGALRAVLSSTQRRLGATNPRVISQADRP